MALSDQLTAARDAYHKLMTGQAAEMIVDQNGEQVRFTRMNSANLAAYISRLEASIAAGDTTVPMPKAIGVWL